MSFAARLSAWAHAEEATRHLIRCAWRQIYNDLYMRHLLVLLQLARCHFFTAPIPTYPSLLAFAQETHRPPATAGSDGQSSVAHPPRAHRSGPPSPTAAVAPSASAPLVQDEQLPGLVNPATATTASAEKRHSAVHVTTSPQTIPTPQRASSSSRCTPSSPSTPRTFSAQRSDILRTPRPATRPSAWTSLRTSPIGPVRLGQHPTPNGYSATSATNPHVPNHTATTSALGRGDTGNLCPCILRHAVTRRALW